MTRSLSLACSVLLLAGCGAGKPGAAPAGGPGKGGSQQFPVEVVTAAAQPVDYRIEAVGSVEAYEIVAITARVAGVIEQVSFSLGDEIAADQVVATIEPQRYRLAAESARAVLDKANASAAEAKSGLERREALNRENARLVSEEEVETWRTRAQAALAEAAGARAAFELAELNQRDAEVRSPLAGVIQSRPVATGQYVQPGTLITTLVRREPLLLKFAVTAPEASELSVGMPVGFRVRGDQHRYSARIKHVAGTADPRSRMVTVAARVQGEQAERDALRPGAFAEVVVPLSTRAAVTVPQTAVRPGERGFIAYVIENGSARERVLDLGLRSSGGVIEVRSGLEAGERLVVRGAEALREGAAVRVTVLDGAPQAPPAGGPPAQGKPAAPAVAAPAPGGSPAPAAAPAGTAPAPTTGTAPKPSAAALGSGATGAVAPARAAGAP